MYRSILLRRALSLCLGATALAAAWQPNTLYPFPEMPLLTAPGRTDTGFYFDTVKTDGVYKRLALPMREGGWSSLERDTTDPTGHTFWTINDRGLNVGHEVNGRNDKVFPFPGYHHKLLKVKVENNAVTVLSTDSIASLENASVYTVGLVSTKASSGEKALKMRLDSAIVDTSAANEISPVINGYDFETVRRHGNSLFLSDEYGPFLVQMDIASKRIVKEWYPGNGLPKVLAKRRANRGMEGMAVTPAGKLVGILQSPMYNQVGGNTNKTRDGEMLRVVWLDPGTGEVREFAYLSDLKGGKRRGRDVKTSEVVALSETRFLVLEQGVDTTAAKKYHIDLFEIDLSAATNLTAMGVDGMVIDGKTLEDIAKKPGDLVKAGIRPVAKRILSGDLLANTHWVSEKPEGLTVIDDSTLAISNDNDYGMTDYDADGIPHLLPESQRNPSIMYLRVPSLSARLADTAFASAGAAFRMTLLHHSDGESQLLDAGNGATDRGGIHRFKALFDTARVQASAKKRTVLAVTAGDNFLAGKEWQASLDRDTSLPIYDGLALDRIGYDALVLGNHDFDFGPDVLARFIRSFPDSKAPFVSGNLDFAQEPGMKAQVDAGRVRKSLVIEKDGQKIGIVAATTPTITFISSPRRTIVDTSVLTGLQTRIDSMVGAGIDKIVLISHLQDVANDTLLAKSLKHVDVMVAGGGDDLLANGIANLQPGDTLPRAMYPIRVKDADGRTVYVVTTPGDYLYLGQLEVDFDAAGEVTGIGQASGPRRTVGGTYADAVGQDAWVKTNVVDPVNAFVSGLATTVVGKTTVGLNGVRNDVRTKATNLGALAADALLWQSWQLRGTYGFDSAVMSLQNGGGIRNNSVLATGDLSLATLFDVAPFGNMFAMYPRLPVTVLKDALENAYRGLPSAAGQFGQIGGATVWVDIAKPAMTVNASGALVTHGSRVLQVVLDRGDTLVKNGIVVDSSRKIPFVTIDFLARGGDGYPLAKDSFVIAPVPQHQVLRNYVATGLGGTVDSLRYPQGFASRIVFVTGDPVGVKEFRSIVPRIAFQNGQLTARFEQANAGAVQLELLDLAGRRLVHSGQDLSAGAHAISLSVPNLPRGLYLARLRGAAGSKTVAVQLLQ